MMKAIPEIVALKERHEERFLKLPGVTGIDVGFKYVAGRRTPEIAIRVMVEQKKKTVTKEEKIPEEIDGVKTDVIERKYFLHQMSNRKRLDDISLLADTGTYDPVRGGISIGPCRAVGGYVYVGTLGAIVKDNATGNPMLLSNFHVMCIDSGWHVGDSMAQPGRVDGGSCPTNVVGSLQRAALTASVDGAVSSLSGRGYSCEIVDIGKVAGTNAAALDMRVRKRGRTTGLTYGTIDSIGLSVNIDYGDGIGVRTLTNQIDIAPDTAHNPAFGDHGDSGSAVVDDNRKVVGLHFAGSSDGHGIANPIAAVLTALNVSVCVAPTKLAIKDVKDAHKELKEGKVEVKEIKEHAKEIKDIKERLKDHKPEKFEFEQTKPIVEQGPKISEVPGLVQPPVEAPTPTADLSKLPTKETIKEKGEIKDHKDQIKDWKEKSESKELKDQKAEGKENKDSKDFKDQKESKENKDQKEGKDHKEQKDNKPELKELKVELKEQIKPEFDKPPAEGGLPKFSDGGPIYQPPSTPGQPGAANLAERIAHLELLVQQLSTFITAAMRPDLGAGALSNEPDTGSKGSC